MLFVLHNVYEAPPRFTNSTVVSFPTTRLHGICWFLCFRSFAQVPDDFISDLYPVEDNYVLEKNGLRSPKSLAELATDTLCRSLPYLDGALPPGLPQDIVDDVTVSLFKHSALNATILRVLRNCELRVLTLAGCRGVTDEWLEPLSSSASTACATPPLLPSPPLGPIAYKSDGMYSADTSMEDMVLDNDSEGRCSSAIDRGTPATANSSPEIFYNAKHEGSSEGEASFCSTSSFVSASSIPHALAMASSSASNPSQEDQNMEDYEEQQAACGSFAGHDCKSDYNKTHFPQPNTNEHLSVCITSHITLLDLRGSQRLTDKGLLQLSDLSSLEIAKLDNCHSIQGRGLIALARSHQLHTLSLANCRRLTDEAIIIISELISLEALSLDGCRCLTDRSMVAIGNLVQLKKLDLSQCDSITDDGLKELEELKNIEELSLGWCRSITDQGIEILTNHHGRSEKLRILGLARIPLTDAGIQHLKKLSMLEELDLNGCFNIGSFYLGNVLAHLTKLTSLDVSYCPCIL